MPSLGHPLHHMGALDDVLSGHLVVLLVQDRHATLPGAVFVARSTFLPCFELVPLSKRM